MSETLFLQITSEEIAQAVPSREYNRLLQLPRDRVLEGDLLDRAQSARERYAMNGKPFVASRRVDVREVNSKLVLLETGISLSSTVLAQRLRAGHAHALLVVAASAGVEVAQEVARLWSEGRPDEAFFLDRFAVAVSEGLLLWVSATLCRASEPAQETLMPHLSPGCGSWDLADQQNVMSLLSGGDSNLGPLQLLSSGALHPQHSVLAVMGITHQIFATGADQLCRCCDLSPCSFRRAPFSGEALRPLEVR